MLLWPKTKISHAPHEVLLHNTRVSSMLDVPAYTLRYWETVFLQLCPVRVNSHRKTIGMRRSIDELTHADAKFLGISDLSNIATIDLANKKEGILRSTLSTEITPEIFKSGADSIAAMLLLFTDEIIWKKTKWCISTKI